MKDLGPTDIKVIAPEPIVGVDNIPDDILKEKVASDKNWLDFIKDPKGINIFSILRFTQKCSVYPMSVFFPLHAINTIIVPALSPNYTPNEILMMVREILPSPITTTKTLVYSIAIHLGSGMLIRAIRYWRKKHNQIVTPSNHESIPESLKEDNSQKAIGLNGGISGFLFGLRKKFKVPPQVASGYTLSVALCFHVLLMKIGPYMSNLDIDFIYVKWLLQNQGLLVKWVFGIIPLATLISSGIYHILAGACQYLGFKTLSSRKKWSNVIFMGIITGGVSLYRLSKSNSDIFGARNYNAILQALYLQ